MNNTTTSQANPPDDNTIVKNIEKHNEENLPHIRPTWP